MPPNTNDNFILSETEEELAESFQIHELPERQLRFRPKEIFKDLVNLDWSKVVFRNVILFILLHIYAVYGIYLCLSGQTRWQTMLFAVLLYWFGGLGITMGAHRLWSHKAFKAVFPVRFILMLAQTMAFQNSIFEWSRDHRVHHKFTETDADPHDARRGFFFAHMGWLMTKKHPDVARIGKTLEFKDLMQDPIVRFQHKFYLPLVLIVCFVFPTVFPMLMWDENVIISLMVAGFMRYAITLHFTWFVNSLAHYVGTRPYDKTIYATENTIVSYAALGEGWHNYHHVFPFDYRASEISGITNKNVTTGIIEFLSKFGLTYDLKMASNALVEKRILRTGNAEQRKRFKSLKIL